VSEQNNDIFKTIAVSVKNDLNSVNEINQSLALAMVGAQAPKELVEELHADV
jgi:AP-2 complex subunit alpha